MLSRIEYLNNDLTTFVTNSLKSVEQFRYYINLN